MIQAGRPGRHRPRLNTEHAIPRQPVYYTGPDGQLLVPAGGVHRSASVSAQRPAHINIYNDNAAAWDDHSSLRPRSAHGVYYDDFDDRVYERRSGSRRPSVSPSHELDPETKGKLKEYEDLKRKEEEKEQKKRIEEKLLMDKIKKDAELAEREKEEKALKKRAIEEFKIKEEEEKQKKQREKEKEDEELRERMRKMLYADGFSSEQVESMIRRAEKRDSGGRDREGSSKALMLSRPTYIKVHRRHLDPETLDVYQLPWEWDDVRVLYPNRLCRLAVTDSNPQRDSSYIIIKQWIPEADQDILFEHTRKLRDRKRLVYTTTELKKEREQQLLLVKRKEPRKRSSWFMT